MLPGAQGVDAAQKTFGKCDECGHGVRHHLTVDHNGVVKVQACDHEGDADPDDADPDDDADENGEGE